jgi:hypothetical protein
LKQSISANLRMFGRFYPGNSNPDRGKVSLPP